ncbi:MAG TPA: hypothetical protein VHJ37_03210 [Thermoleophilaceae bacterium]|jgi:hypothetical protein|nr:hypothetical protein [Thermoleophilaceae bacterium]
MADSRSELERALADAGGAQAVREWSARLRALLDAELERGLSELELPRTGYDSPIVAAVAPRDGAVLAALPVVKELRADTGAVGDRAAALAIAVVEQVVEGASPGPPRAAEDLRLELGSLGEVLVLSYPAASPLEAAEYAEEGLNTEFESRRIDRLRARALLVPGHVLDGVDDLRAPIGPTHPLRVAEAVTRLGASPLDEEAVDVLEAQLLQLLEPAGSVARAHEDPDPSRRVTRRILQRLDGMGKWGGYHTAFDHLARGFAGNERALAYEVGEALVEADLLAEKPSVGQRHVCLNPRKTREIRRLIDDGELPPGLTLP